MLQFLPPRRFWKRTLIDANDLLKKDFEVDTKNVRGTKILVFNWRDNSHVFAGGAEVYVHELSKRLVSEGNHVTLFCGNDGRAPRYEIVDGVYIVRRGGFYLVYLWAFLYYMLKFRNKYDVVIDCENGIPFFTPLYVRKPIFCVLHHVHLDIFSNYLNRPMALLAKFLEGTLMPLVYLNVPFITVSQSTKMSMKEIGLGKKGIYIVQNGVDLLNLIPGAKATNPLVLYLGRLKEYKSVDILIKAFKSVLDKTPNANLIIAGSGTEESNLKKLTENLGLTGSVSFLGKVTEEEKIKLMQRAWAFVNPSYIEGWGITVIEANACGTLVVASDVAGLRDSVKNSYNGFLVDYGNITAFSSKIIEVLQNSLVRESCSKNAVIWASKFSWDMSAQLLISIIKGDLYL